jgi:DNA-binding response OmpR family regulator
MATLLKPTNPTDILSVDDNLDYLHLLAKVLQPQGYTVLKFSKLMNFHKV